MTFIHHCIPALIVYLLLLLPPGFGQVLLQLDRDRQLSWTGAASNAAVLVQTRSDLLTGDWESTVATDELPASIGPVILPDASRRFVRAVSLPRGEIVAVQDLGTTSAFIINLGLAFSGIPTSVSYNVNMARVSYRTLDATNGTTLASGIFAWPANAPGARPLLSLQHATILLRSDAPTESTTQQTAALITAGRGYITCLPDFLGFGDSPGLHPFVQSKATATAVIDMLRAGRQQIASRNINWNGKLFLAGYSQGGHATMATHRMLQLHHASEWTVSASVPMAGPYDFSVTMYEELINNSEPYGSPYFLPYVLFGSDEVYGPLAADSVVMQEPYSIVLRPLFNGQNSGGTINNSMPTSGIPAEIFQPAYRAAFQADPNHPLRQRLARNDLIYDWAPTSPMLLIHCAGDELVPYANSTKARALFQAAGATQVQLSTPDAGGAAITHTDCATPALLEALGWLDLQ